MLTLTGNGVVVSLPIVPPSLVHRMNRQPEQSSSRVRRTLGVAVAPLPKSSQAAVIWPLSFWLIASAGVKSLASRWRRRRNCHLY